jgi:hypothetical protein
MQIPPMMPRKTLEPKVALSDAGADSAVYMALATSSPPTLKPCAQARRWIRVLGFGFWVLGVGVDLQSSADEEEERGKDADAVVAGGESDGKAGGGHKENSPDES